MHPYDVNMYIRMNVRSRKGVIFLHGNIIQTLWTSSPTGQPCIHCFVHTYVHSSDDVHMHVCTYVHTVTKKCAVYRNLHNNMQCTSA